MKNTFKEISFGSDTAVRYSETGNAVAISDLILRRTSILRRPIQFRYRYLLNEPTPWRELTWSSITLSKGMVSLCGDIRINDEKKYIYALTMTLKSQKYHIAEKNFCGVSISFETSRKMPFAMELEMSVHPGNIFESAHIQDLYTKDKTSCIRTENWSGIPNAIWQSQRSPFDLFTSETGAMLVRISSLSQIFSSFGRYEKNEGPVLQYKWIFESASVWKSSEIHLLYLKCKMDLSERKDLWCSIFLDESERFRKAARIKREEVLPMANIPVDGGTFGCAAKKYQKLQHFDAFTEKAIQLCTEMDFRRLLVGSPWISYRSLGMPVKANSSITYDSRCGTWDIEVSDEYGGRRAFRAFCDKMHEQGVEVFAWFPGLHMANHSRCLTEHPEWIMRKSDGSPCTHGYFHITAISPRPEVMEYFIENMKKMKTDCGFDGLWLDSFSFSFMSLDYSREKGVSDALNGIAMIKRFQDIGLKVINEGYSPFGARGDGEALFFKNQEEMAMDTTLFTYYKSIPAVLKDNSYFRFLANKAPLTISAEYVPANKRMLLKNWNAAFCQAVKHMKIRTLLPKNTGVKWYDGKTVEILYPYESFRFSIPRICRITNLTSGKMVSGMDAFEAKKFNIYKISWQN